MRALSQVVHEALAALRPVDRRALVSVGTAALGGVAAAIYVAAWADGGGLVGLCIGVYCGVTLQDALHAVVATLTPSTRSERRRAHRMARAAGVALPEDA